MPNDKSSGDQRAAASVTGQSSAAPKVQQPKPQALPSRASLPSILVSPRQKGNPILTSIRSVPWEYSDIPADYVLGATTCALFLSLKYHRLHPEYVYGRIRQLAGKYALRVMLVMVDIDNHEEPLKELAKTSLINNVTLVLTWSAAEAGRYLELFKLYEHAAPTSIRGAPPNASYGDRIVEFVTAPRSINKTDAVGLVSNFGSLRTAINARPEEVALVAGWGDKKVQRWCGAVREPFMTKRTANRATADEAGRPTPSRTEPDARVASRLGIGPEPAIPSASNHAPTNVDAVSRIGLDDADHGRLPDADEEEAMLDAVRESQPTTVPASTGAKSSTKRLRPNDDVMSESIASALAKLRKDG